MAGRKPKGEIMTQDEMIEYGKQKRATSTVYKGEVMQLTNDAIRTIVNRGLAEIINADMQKINLSDSEQVKAVSKAYIQACADTSTIPSMAGLARAMGCHRGSLYYWMKQKDTETGRWLLMCQDLFSDLLTDGALKNNINPIVSIFLLKAQYGLRDNMTIEEIQSGYTDNYYENGNHSYKDRYRKLLTGEFE